MRRMRNVAGLVVLMGVLSPLRADLHFPEPLVKLGEACTGTPLRQLFTFTNHGPNTVSIYRLEAACGCMTPRLDRQVYRSGESGSFVLEVNTLTQPAGPNI